MKRLIILFSMALVLLIGISTANASQPHPPAPFAQAPFRAPEIGKMISGEGERATPLSNRLLLSIGEGPGVRQGASVNKSPQSGYDLSWYTVDGGGATFSTGGSYSLGGAIGQPEAVGQVGNSPYTLVGGFWGGVSITNYDIYLPLVEVGG